MSAKPNQTPASTASAAAAKAFAPADKQLEAILRGHVDCIEKEDLKKRLEKSAAKSKPMRIKLGIDPSSPDIHLGHTVVLRKLRQFQDLGHQAVLIIGDYTAMVGDPTGKSKTRPQLTEAEVKANAQTYLDQVGHILNLDTLEIRHNGEWFSKMGFMDVLRLAGKTTVARMLERDDFTKRHQSGVAISLHEFLYPLMQGHDSVMVQADVELGGTDQLFNLLMGRKLQEEAGQQPQICLTTPIIPGLDGVQKMSKSLGNAIGVRETPTEMFGKVMSIPDTLMRDYFTLLTGVGLEDVGSLVTANPRDAKDRLAREIVTTFHGQAAAHAASEEFVRRFRQGGLPDDIPAFAPSKRPIGVLDLLVEAKLAPSKGEARRLVEQGGVSLIDAASGATDGTVISDMKAELACEKGFVLKVGKRRFIRFE